MTTFTGYELPEKIENRDEEDLYIILDEIQDLLSYTSFSCVYDYYIIQGDAVFSQIPDDEWEEATENFDKIIRVANAYFEASELFPCSGKSPLNIDSDLRELQEVLYSLQGETPSLYAAAADDEDWEIDNKKIDDAGIIEKMHALYNFDDWISSTKKELVF